LLLKGIIFIAHKREIIGIASKREIIGTAPKREIIGVAPKREIIGVAPKREMIGIAPKREIIIIIVLACLSISQAIQDKLECGLHHEVVLKELTKSGGNMISSVLLVLGNSLYRKIISTLP
jgi:hypothetical protein